MKTRITVFAFFSMILLSFATSLQAALTLDFNTTDQTFAFFGSDTGTTGNPGGGNGTAWWSILSVPGGPAGTTVGYNNDVAFTTTAGTPGGGWGYDVDLGVSGPGDLNVILNTNVVNTLTTITGTGVYQPYNPGLDPWISTEPFATVPQYIWSTGFDDLNVTYNASSASGTPEPSTLVLAVLGIVGLATTRRRRRRA